MTVFFFGLITSSAVSFLTLHPVFLFYYKLTGFSCNILITDIASSKLFNLLDFYKIS